MRAVPVCCFENFLFFAPIYLMVVSFDATRAAVFHHHLALCIHFNCFSKNKVPIGILQSADILCC